jgi:hypothetical protein
MVETLAVRVDTRCGCCWLLNYSDIINVDFANQEEEFNFGARHEEA